MQSDNPANDQSDTDGNSSEPAQTAASSAFLPKQRPSTLKHGDTFAVFDRNGDAVAEPGSSEGIYHCDTRYLSTLQLTIDGMRPLLLSSTLRDDNAILTCDLTNPDLRNADGSLGTVHDLIHIRRSRFLWNTRCFERVSVRNFDETAQRLRIEIAFASDFADLFEVRGAHREKRGQLDKPEIHSDRVVLSYTGLDWRKRQTAIRFDPVPTRLTGSLASFEMALDPHSSRSILIEIECNPDAPREPVSRSFFFAMRDARRALRTTSSDAASVTTSSEVFNEAVHRCIADLNMLITQTPEGPYPYAGIPWFSTPFGRDALITALETLWINPGITRGVLGYLAANQAKTVDPAADAEPGKILHEVRHGEMAELGEVPFRRYYGSVDSTPLFVMLAGAYLERTGDVGTIARLWPNIEAALGWMEVYGDRDGDGFIEYFRQTASGLANQGWKDSHNSIFHADGRLADGPIALCEVQAYAYGAWVGAAEMARRLGHDDTAKRWHKRAENLRLAFDAAFFDEELGTYVLALDGEKRPCRVRSSNAGHALLTGIALPERVPVIVATLMAGASFSGWGIRTIASSEIRYNPMSYHNGSVWPHDNALIAAGLARYGFKREATRIFEGLFAASTYIDLRRLPELFCGMPRKRSQGPTFYPVACIPQAWAAAAPLSLIQSCLGLSFDPADMHVVFNEPLLPDFLDRVDLKRLRIGNEWADVTLRRSGRKVVVDVSDRSGPVRVLTMS